MNSTNVTKPYVGGSSLIETVIAMSVLAVAIPLVFAALAESGKCNNSAECETRSTWIVAVCMEEIQASREGKSEFFTATKLTETFPPAGEFWALAFSSEGKPIAKITRSEYDKGIKEINGKPIRYLTTLSSLQISEKGMIPIILRTSISLEYPSVAPLSKRHKLAFHSLIS
jgi:hypothetical protein